MRALRFVIRGIWAFLISTLFFITWLVGTLILTLFFRGRESRQAYAGRILVVLFRQLGATYVKVGQIMSTRPDLFPPRFVQELEALQDNVGAFAFRHVRRMFSEDFGRVPNDIFRDISEEPVASASVAQVHRAVMQDGRVVAIKIRRPDIEHIVAFDLFFICNFARFLNWLPFLWIFNLYDSAKEFADAIYSQLDLRLEAENNLRFQEHFKDHKEVMFPKLVPEFCSKRILTMDYIDGQRILDYRGYDADPKKLARLGLQSVLKMVFIDGFVHADLHPGNIWVTPNHNIALLDLGLVANLEERDKTIFRDFFVSWASKDGKTMAKMMAEFSPDAKIADYSQYESDICSFVDRYGSAKIGESGVAHIFLDMMAILRRHRVRSNPTFTMVNLALGVTEGIGRQLDGDIDLMQVATQFFMSMQSASNEAKPQVASMT